LWYQGMLLKKYAHVGLIDWLIVAVPTGIGIWSSHSNLNSGFNLFGTLPVRNLLWTGWLRFNSQQEHGFSFMLPYQEWIWCPPSLSYQAGSSVKLISHTHQLLRSRIYGILPSFL
jgi:hypothetical protein